MAVISSETRLKAVAASRLDAEYFDPADVKLLRKLTRDGGVRLDTVCEVMNGVLPDGYVEDGEVPIVRSGDLVAPFIYPDCGRAFLRAPRSDKLLYLRDGDVLISSIGLGSIGKISRVMDAGSFATVAEVTVVRPKTYPSAILFAYLTTATGQRQLLREVTGATGQQHLLKGKVATVLVPSLPDQPVIDAVEAACQRAWELEKETMNELERIHELYAGAVGVHA